jgi:hypothetical protein
MVYCELLFGKVTAIGPNGDPPAGRKGNPASPAGRPRVFSAGVLAMGTTRESGFPRRAAARGRFPTKGRRHVKGW